MSTLRPRAADAPRRAPDGDRPAPILARWSPSRVTTILIAVAFAVTALIRVTGTPFSHSFGELDRIDIDVYRLGAQMWRNGGSLYASGSMPFTSDGIWLPFTYPPFAALSFLPFTVVPLVVAGTVMATITVIATVVGTAVVLRRLRIGSSTNRRWLVLAVATAALWTNPYWMTLGFGQINVVLLVLVAVDLLVLGPRGSRWHGTLIGVAAAIKLTPLAFVLYLVVRRDGRAVARAVGTFAVAAVVALIWAPTDSIRYWSHTVFHTDRIGDLAGGINQSVNGMWIRLLGEGGGEKLVWAASVLVLTTLAWFAISRAQRLGGDVLSVCVTALWAVMVSPTSWAHHWVWAVPAILALAAAASRSDRTAVRRTLGVLAASGTVVLVLAPFQFFHGDPRHWSVPETVLGNAFCLWGLAVLITMVALGGVGVRLSPDPTGGDAQAAGSDRASVDG
ncbi:glycosyltransferase 87 family protein [Williamsia deligens]|uniref:Glycosyltransferase 87 family protein n=1 Tax=Williamsia deligens TaxID=321325 RepID=A0ABW3GDR1_9NOCA|nr:glycosyltransferase 87 family protein [Williamsia deligens]